jgi:hypothetical protein
MQPSCEISNPSLPASELNALITAVASIKSFSTAVRNNRERCRVAEASIS